MTLYAHNCTRMSIKLSRSYRTHRNTRLGRVTVGDSSNCRAKVSLIRPPECALARVGILIWC